MEQRQSKSRPLHPLTLLWRTLPACRIDIRVDVRREFAPDQEHGEASRPPQFPVGIFSTRSITSTSTGPLRDSIFNPN
jgi:hypothetical protein